MNAVDSIINKEIYTVKDLALKYRTQYICV